MINPYTVGLAALTLIASFGLGYLQGKEHGLVQYYELRANVETQTAKLQADADQARADSERITADVSDAWSNALDYYRNNPRIVRLQPTTCSNQASLRPIPSTSGITPTATTQSGLDTAADAALTITIQQCEQIADNAVQDAAQLIHLQHWVQQQHEVQR